MIKPIQSILFATNLSENCRAALEASVAMATQHKARLVLLHVMDREVPSHVESHFKDLLGEEKWKALIAEHEKEAHETLVGKMSSGKIGHKAMKMYCEEAGIDMQSCDFPFQEAVVADSSIVDAIIAQCGEHSCNLIVLGGQKGFFAGNAIGSVVKGVLRKASVPVLVVPPHE